MIEAGGVILSADVAESRSYIVSSAISGVSNYARRGDDLVVELSSGQTLHINIFFINGPAFHKLFLVDSGARVQADFSHAMVSRITGFFISRSAHQYLLQNYWAYWAVRQPVRRALLLLPK